MFPHITITKLSLSGRRCSFPLPRIWKKFLYRSVRFEFSYTCISCTSEALQPMCTLPLKTNSTRKTGHSLASLHIATNECHTLSIHVCTHNNMFWPNFNVGRMLALGIPQNKMPPHWMYYASNPHMYISTKTYIFVLMIASLWSTTNGKASWTINGHHRHQQGIYQTRKLQGCEIFSFCSCSWQKFCTCITQSLQ